MIASIEVTHSKSTIYHQRKHIDKIYVPLMSFATTKCAHRMTCAHLTRRRNCTKCVHRDWVGPSIATLHRMQCRMVLTCWTSYGNLYAHGRFMEMSIGAFYHMRYADIIIFCQRQCITTAKPNFMLNVFGMWGGGGVAAACRWHERFIIQMKCVCVCVLAWKMCCE